MSMNVTSQARTSIWMKRSRTMTFVGLLSSYLIGDDRSTLKYFKCKVHNDVPEMRNESGAPLRTFSGGVFLNGFSDHFPPQI